MKGKIPLYRVEVGFVKQEDGGVGFYMAGGFTGAEGMLQDGSKAKFTEVVDKINAAVTEAIHTSDMTEGGTSRAYGPGVKLGQTASRLVEMGSEVHNTGLPPEFEDDDEPIFPPQSSPIRH